MKDLTLTNEGTEFYKRGFHRFDTKFECPICHGHDFGSGSRTGLGGYYKTVLQCLTNAFGTPNPQCKGELAYCKKCNKWLPFSEFGNRNDTYECKECGTVQWDLTELMKIRSAAQIARARMR